MILYRESAVNEKFTNTDGASVSEYVRIKIFTQEGTDQANVEIPFFKDSSDIESVRARTIRPDGTMVNFEGKPFEKIIEKRSGEKILAKTFTLPDVQPGCIIEYKYRRRYKPLQTTDLDREHWLLACESARHTFLTISRKAVKKNPLFAEMLANGITFYRWSIEKKELILHFGGAPPSVVSNWDA
jgi:hypothetical protein